MATATSVAYALLTLGCAAAYAFAGMTGFEAVTHAMSTVSTGGYSTYDASLGHFANPAIDWVAMVFMLLGALPFVIYIQIAHGRGAAVWHNRSEEHTSELPVTNVLHVCRLLLVKTKQSFT